MIGILLIAAQTILSTHPPLSPAEAVAVLRASQSPYDVTGLPFYGGDQIGPMAIVIGGSGLFRRSTADLIDQPAGYTRDMLIFNDVARRLARFEQGPRGARWAPTVTPWTMQAPRGSRRRQR